jgi:hypothetical protein
MGRFRAFLGLAVAVVGVACSESSVAPAKPVGNPAEEPAVVERCLAEACAFVEETCGRKFSRRPTVFVCQEKAMSEVRLSMSLEDWGPVDPKERAELEWEAKRGGLAALWDEPRNRIVLVADWIPKFAAGDPPVSREDVLRLVLVHEAAHAWVDRHVGQPPTEGGRLVDEGHAHYVAERAARRWDVYPAFERLTRGMVGPPCAIRAWDEPARHPRFPSDAHIAYEVARAFVARVWSVRGRDGVHDVLREPPARSLLLERPDDWLDDRSVATEDGLDRAIASLRAIVPRSSWRVAVGDVHGDVVLRETSLLARERRWPLRRAFEAGWGMEAESRDSPGRFVASAVRFRDAATAAAYVEACRDSVPIFRETARTRREWRCDERDWSPAPAISGFVCLWTSPGVWATRTVTARIGRHVLHVGVNDPIVRDEAWLLENALRAIRGIVEESNEEPLVRAR